MKNNIITNYFISAWRELKKVTWPTRKEVVNHTVVVLVSIVVATGVVTALDYGLSELIQYVIQ